MQVSLKEARRIERRIQEKGLRKGYPLRAYINIFSDAPVAETIEAEAEKVEERVDATVNLVMARADIRRQIQVTNETAGINDLIARREKYIRLISLWEDVRETATDLKPSDVLERTVETRRARAENGKEDYYSSRPDTVEFIAVSEGLQEKASRMVLETQAIIDDCDDQLAALNATTKVEIADHVVAFLKEQEII